jgi:hypothetical protein
MFGGKYDPTKLRFPLKFLSAVPASVVEASNPFCRGLETNLAM